MLEHTLAYLDLALSAPCGNCSPAPAEQQAPRGPGTICVACAVYIVTLRYLLGTEFTLQESGRLGLVLRVDSQCKQLKMCTSWVCGGQCASEAV